MFDPIGSEQLQLFTLEFRKIDEFDFVYTLASANIDQSAPDLVEIYMTNRSQMSLILCLTHYQTIKF